MATPLYETLTNNEVTSIDLVEAARLFSSNYGTWGEGSGRAGEPIKASPRRLREQYLPDAGDGSYTKVTIDGRLAGQAFACRWKCNGKTVCWIAQLVVDKQYRERGLASGLLRSLMKETDDIYGIMSSNPAACLAAAKVFGSSIENVSFDYIKTNAEAVLASSPVHYVRSAQARGSIFSPEESTGLVSGADSAFFIDHEEPMKNLKRVREARKWPLGELPDGHEYLLILPGKLRHS
ncbi:hypothetical protein SEPCBS119000_003226 [Sporothrix epigloea]|uniref:N-acetyltransferase domain-containing protein n=1 Tax=Sporothrix epigloea TaxID=1892477 RepID=A0ABP0DKE6_9PEZI